MSSERHIPSLPATADRPRLIVVEDGSALSRLLARYLDNAELAPAASAEEALEAIAAISGAGAAGERGVGGEKPGADRK